MDLGALGDEAKTFVQGQGASIVFSGFKLNPRDASGDGTPKAHAKELFPDAPPSVRWQQPHAE